MLRTLFRSKLSPIYHKLLPENVLNIEIPNERFADCMDCYHCHNANNTSHSIKCCSYHPILPNYMVGAILNDKSPEMAEGKKRIIKKIKGRIGVTPYGIIPPTEHQVLYNKYIKKSKGELAKSKELANALQCAYQSEESLCTIWKYRTELCSTYHCASTSGQIGQIFWRRAFQYLTSMEQKLSLYALQEMGYAARAIQTKRLNPITLGLDNADGTFNEPIYQELWKQWEGKEVVFFEKCFQSIKKIDQKKVIALSGIEESINITQLSQQAEKMLQNEIPDFLKLDKTHPEYRKIEIENQLVLANKQILKISPIKLKFLGGFNGTMPTLTIIKKAFIIKKGITQLILPLIKIGVLKRV